MGGGLHTEVFISMHYYSIERDRNLQLLRQLNAHAAELCAPRIARSCFTIARADREFDRYAITELPSYIIDWPASCKRALHTSVLVHVYARTVAAEKFFQLRPKRRWFARSDEWSVLCCVQFCEVTHMLSTFL